jgi:hypothetical protein
MGGRPKVVQSNPEEQARIAAEKAAIAANQETAARRVRVGRDRLPSALGQAASTLGNTGTTPAQAQQANQSVLAAVADHQSRETATRYGRQALKGML